ncbi:MAG: hypothetical protein JXX28_17910 [Deltaproteobacteria bacterium]|nr:hypothetical protein [Deltaproteobacteria bacterium]
MKIRILTSCTRLKALHHPEPLRLPDFQQGGAHLLARSQALAREAGSLPAGELYTGAQHLELLRGVRAGRAAGLELELWVLSAGYGLIPEDRPLVPYDVTFNGMRAAEERAWAEHLGLPQAMREWLAQPADQALVLLGVPYLRACALSADTPLGAPTAFTTGPRAARRLPRGASAWVHTLEDARRLGVSLGGIKGAMGRRAIEAWAEDL